MFWENNKEQIIQKEANDIWKKDTNTQYTKQSESYQKTIKSIKIKEEMDNLNSIWDIQDLLSSLNLDEKTKNIFSSLDQDKKEKFIQLNATIKNRIIQDIGQKVNTVSVDKLTKTLSMIIEKYFKYNNNPRLTESMVSTSDGGEIVNTPIYQNHININIETALEPTDLSAQNQEAWIENTILHKLNEYKSSSISKYIPIEIQTYKKWKQIISLFDLIGANPRLAIREINKIEEKKTYYEQTNGNEFDIADTSKYINMIYWQEFGQIIDLGYEVMFDMLSTPHFKEVLDYFSDGTKKVQVWWEEIAITNDFRSLNIVRWIVEMYEKKQLNNVNEAIKMRSDFSSDFIEIWQNQKFDKVFNMTPKNWDDVSWAFGDVISHNQNMWKFAKYNTAIELELQSGWNEYSRSKPMATQQEQDEIIDQIKNQTNEGEQILLNISGHGGMTQDEAWNTIWTLLRENKMRPMSFFERIANENMNIKIFMDSCYSGFKFDQISDELSSIVMTWDQTPASGRSDDVFRNLIWDGSNYNKTTFDRFAHKDPSKRYCDSTVSVSYKCTNQTLLDKYNLTNPNEMWLSGRSGRSVE